MKLEDQILSKKQMRNLVKLDIQDMMDMLPSKIKYKDENEDEYIINLGFREDMICYHKNNKIIKGFLIGNNIKEAVYNLLCWSLEK